MITASEYSVKSGLVFEEVVERIQSGVYVGEIIDGVWHMEEPMFIHDHDSRAEMINVSQQSAKVTENNIIPTSYGTTRVLSKIGIFIGWLAVAIGVFLLLVAIVERGRGSGEAMIIGAAVLLGGFSTVLANQVVLAIVDTADNTRALLEVMRNKVKD